MFLYTLFIFVFFISIQSSHGYGIDYADVEDHLLKNKLNVTASNIDTTTAPAVQNEKVCDTAVNLQKILKLMISMLRQDVSQNVKTASILETLKDLLRNTAGDNDEVMFKIDDLLRTLDKYKESGENRVKKHLRGILDNTRKLSEQAILNYEPVLTNSYCTEALLNIMKVAYEAYVSLAKNPICNIPGLPQFPSLSGPNPILPEFMNLETPPIPQPKISVNQYLKSTLPPFAVSDLPSYYQPPNKNTNYFVPIIENILNPKKDTQSPKIEQLPTQVETIYENLPYGNSLIPTDNSQFPDYFPYAPLNQNNLYLNQIVPNNPIINELGLTLPAENGSVSKTPYIPLSQDVMPFYYTPASPGTYPRPNPQTTVPILPWSTESQEFPYDVKSQSTPYNLYTPDATFNPHNIPEVVWPLPWEKTSEFPININPNGPYENAKEIVYEFPINKQVSLPEEFPSNINPVINSLYPNHILPPPITSHQESLTSNYWIYPPHSMPQASNLSPFFTDKPIINDKLNAFYPEIVNQDTRIPENIDQPNGLAPEFFPIGSTLIPYGLYRPYPNNLNMKPTNTFENQKHVPNSNANLEIVEPEAELFEFNPNNLSSSLPPRYPFIPIAENPVYNYKLKPIFPNIPAYQNSVYELKWNPYGVPMYHNIPKSPYNWKPNSPSAITAQNLHPILLNAITTPTLSNHTLEVSELKIIGFIRHAIKIIEEVIPIIKFDPPTINIIATIKDIVQKNEDIKAEEFATIMKLYMKLINYVEQLKAYKEIIDIIDLSRVTNRHKLENKKVVELTYLLKRPQPVLYYPYYYVKYRLPYTSFLLEANNLLKEKPHLRMNPKQLYDELLALSQVAETSPDLKNLKKEDILLLTFKSGSLVDTKLVANGTLDEQLNVLREITSELTAEEILKLNEEATNQIQLIVNNPVAVNTYQTYNDTSDLNSLYIDMLMKGTDEGNGGDLEKKEETSPLITEGLIKEKTPANTNQNDPTTKSNLGFTSFNSAKLRSDILRGDVGLPYSDYAGPTNVSPLNSVANTNINRGPIVPTINKLFDATLKAKKRATKLREFINSDGLVSFDNSKVSFNTGRGNSQTGMTFYNQKKMVNTAKNDETSIDTTNRHNFMKMNKNEQAHYQDLLNQHNIWTNQQNYYNKGGLVNFDNQKVLLNTGTGNSQDNVIFFNPKEVMNEVVDTIDFDKTRSSKTPSDLHFINDDLTGPYFSNSGTTKTRFGVTNEGLQDETYTEASNEATIGYNDLVNFAKEGMQLVSQESNKNFQTPNSKIKQTTDLQNLVADVSTEKPSFIGKTKRQEMAEFIKNAAKEEMSQYEDSDTGKTFLSTGEPNYQNSNFNNYQSLSEGQPLGHVGSSNSQLESSNSQLGSSNSQRKPSIGHVGSSSNQDLSNVDIAALLLNAGNSNRHKLLESNTNNVNLGGVNQELMNYDAAKFMLNTGNTKKEGYGFKQGMMTDSVTGHQINRYVIKSLPIFNRRPILNRFSMMSSRPWLPGLTDHLL